MKIGDFVAYTTYMIQLTWPVIALGWVINIFQRGTASAARIAEILNTKPEIDDRDAVLTPSGQPKYTKIQGEIEFCNLNFSYEGTPILHEHQSEGAGRYKPGDCRPDGVRQDNPGKPDSEDSGRSVRSCSD